MARKCHPTPLSGGDHKATLSKELDKARAMANVLATQSAEMRAKGEAMIRQADKLLCESWNEPMWSAGELIDPPDHRPGGERRLAMAGDPMRAKTTGDDTKRRTRWIGELRRLLALGRDRRHQASLTIALRVIPTRRASTSLPHVVCILRLARPIPGLAPMALVESGDEMQTQ
jgi:hypothetical protein